MSPWQHLAWQDEQINLKLEKESKRKKRNSIPDDARQLEFLQKACRKEHENVLAYGNEEDRAEEALPGRLALRWLLLKRGFRRKLHALNPWSGGVWRDHLFKAIKEVTSEDDKARQPFFVTVLEEGWDFVGDDLPLTAEDLLARKRVAERAARNRLRGLSYFLQLDISLHRFKKAFGKRRVCVHFHGIVWGTQAEVKAAIARFKPGFHGAPGGKATAVYDLPGALRYVTKDTRCAYVISRRGGWDNPDRVDRLFRYREPHTRENRRFLLRLFGGLTKPELCIASGIGCDVLKHACASARRHGWRRSEHFRAS